MDDRRLVRRVAVDELWHLFFGYLVTFPLLFFHTWAVFVVPLVVLLVDLDHFVSAKSFSLEKALSLRRRPPLHSLTLAFLFSLVVAFVWGYSVGYLLLALWVSHLLRDLSDGAVALFWPLKRQVHLPKKHTYPLFALLFALSFLIALNMS